jgi:hypothetical protein
MGKARVSWVAVLNFTLLNPLRLGKRFFFKNNCTGIDTFIGGYSESALVYRDLVNSLEAARLKQDISDNRGFESIKDATGG